MKEHLITQLKSIADPIQARHHAREYLQAQILLNIQRAGGMGPLAFHGGTALRFLYDLPRFSEDLDFALEGGSDNYHWRSYVKRIQSNLEQQGYPIRTKITDRKTVHKTLIRFPGILFDANVSPHQDETLTIKLEVDTNPPAGAGLTTTLVRKHVLLNLQHHDPASLLAGKLLAILLRPYTKGRDIYDLFWYLTMPDWPAPNLMMLNNGLADGGWQGETVTATNWKGVVSGISEMLDKLAMQ